MSQNIVGEGRTDPRIERTRAALLAAAITVVRQRGTTEVPLTDIAKTAGVSRQAAYLHYRDLTELLLDAAIDLIEREVGPFAPLTDPRGATMRMTTHFHDHRDFYRAMLSGRCAYALHLRILELLRHSAPESMWALDSRLATDLGNFVTGGAGTIITQWVLDPADESTPHELADRIEAVQDAVASGLPSARLLATAGDD